MSTNHLCSSLIDDSSRREQSKRRKVFISHERLSTNYPSSSLFAIKAERSQPAAASVGLVREKECVCGVGLVWPYGLGKAHRPPNAAPTLFDEREVSWQKKAIFANQRANFQVEG